MDPKYIYINFSKKYYNFSHITYNVLIFQIQNKIYIYLRSFINQIYIYLLIPPSVPESARYLHH